ncbi:hypothetical protein L1G40_001978 [Staphylococcus pseudintermedius]|nr:hypothetical protein [Staphylococcus pseudintermedius]
MRTQSYLSELFKNIEDWEAVFKDTMNQISNIELSNKNIVSDLQRLEEIYICLDSLHTYVLVDYELHIKSKEKRTNLEKVEMLYDLLHYKSKSLNNYIYDNLEEVIHLIDNNSKTRKYKIYYTNIFKNKKSEINHLYDSLNLRNYYDYLFYNDEFLCSFEHKEIHYNINTSNFLYMLTSDDRELRKKVYTKSIEKLSSQKTHAAFVLNAHYQVKNKIAISNGKKNHFENLLEDMLFQMDESSFNKASNKVSTLFKETIDIRRKLMGNEFISHYDLYYLGHDNSFISFETSKNILKNAFKIFGETYSSILERVFVENWVHYEESNNKRLGARSYSSYNSHPYIILNWKNDLESLFALSHEVGGAIAQYLSQSSNSILYSETSEIKIEFMSFINEIVLLEHLLNSNYNEISKKELHYKFLEILKDDLFVPFEYVNIVRNLSISAGKGLLNEDIISKEYVKEILNFRDYKNFSDIEVNKWNWIKGHEGLMVEYNVYYIQAFLFAINYEHINFSEVLNLLAQGEQIDDYKFFSNIFDGELDFENFNAKAINKIKKLTNKILN